MLERGGKDKVKGIVEGIGDDAHEEVEIALMLNSS